MPFLIYETGPSKGQAVRLEVDKVYTVGRDQTADITVEDELVSRVHAGLRGKEGRFFLKDAGSSNGTLVNDHPIDAVVELKSGDRITIGTTLLSFLSDEEAGGAAGRTLGGYKLLQRLGRGGMGTVYRALQLSLNREVALKILSPELSQDPAFVERFLKEARAAGQLNHPNIVQVYDVDRADGLTFYAMEFMPGGTVEDRLNQGGRLSVEEALKWLRDAARGLQYAELKKLIHRDIKPANLMLTDIGTIKIADLGLALAAHEGEAGGAILGTPHFISPEQARGLPLDVRSDLYSLGATFFRMLTGKTLFHGANAQEILRQQVKDEPPSVREQRPDVPEKVAALLQRLVKKDPAERFQSASQLIEEIEKVQARSGGRKAVVFSLLAVVIAAVGVALGLRGNGSATPDNGSPVTVVDDSGTRELTEQMAEQTRLLERQKVENDALAARLDLDEHAGGLAREELAAALRALEAKFPGTEAGAKALAKAAEIEAEIESEKRGAAERSARAAAVVADLESRVGQALAQKRFAVAQLALLQTETDSADLRQDAVFAEAVERLRARVAAEAEAALTSAMNGAVTALDAGSFDAARRAVDEIEVLLAGRDLLPEEARALRDRLAEAAASAELLRARVAEAEQAHRLRLLGADLKRLRNDFDWNSFFQSIREYRFADALSSLEILRGQLATAEYREYLGRRTEPLRDAAAALEAFRTAVASGTLGSTLIVHPERQLQASIVGLAAEGDGIQIEIARTAGSARSVLRFHSFDTVDKFLDLFLDRCGTSGRERLAVARGALALSAAQQHLVVRAIAAQLRAYDPQAGWSAAQRQALAGLKMPVPASQKLPALFAELAQDPALAEAAAALQARFAQEAEATALFEQALEPFRSDAPGLHFAEAASKLGRLVADYRGSDLFLAAYEILDDGSATLALAGGSP